MGKKKVTLRLDSEKWLFKKTLKGGFFFPQRMIECEKKELLDLKGKGLPFIEIHGERENIHFLKASTGIIRSSPLFFGEREEGIFVSDDPKKVGEFLGRVVFNLLSLLEFLAFGFVCSDRTLIEGVKQVPAGQTLLFEGEEFCVKNEYWYDFGKPQHQKKEQLEEVLGRVSNQVFLELRDEINGRIPVVPLSGGYDSRFIVAMLKKMGFKKVICLSYGVSGNWETKKSKMVAELLGFDWIFVEHSRETWRRILGDPVFYRFVSFAHNFSSSSHLQEFGLLKFLGQTVLGEKKENLVFIPGHAADFVAGSHLNSSSWTSKNPKSCVEAIMNRHYKLCHPPWNEKMVQEILRQVRVEYNGFSEFWQIYEAWNWRERQSKFIANANRVYDFFGYCWALPFWKKGFVDFWGAVPGGFKLKKNLYDEFLENGLFREFGIDFDSQKHRESRNKSILEITGGVQKDSRIKQIAKKNLLFSEIYRKSRRLFCPGKYDPCGFESLLPRLGKFARGKFPCGRRKLSEWKREYGLKQSEEVNAYIANFIVAGLLEEGFLLPDENPASRGEGPSVSLK